MCVITMLFECMYTEYVLLLLLQVKVEVNSMMQRRFDVVTVPRYMYVGIISRHYVHVHVYTCLLLPSSYIFY